jgi:hypothetical protein
VSVRVCVCVRACVCVRVCASTPAQHTQHMPPGYQVPDIIQIQLLAIHKCASDSSPYVRRCAATAVSKIHALDPSQLPQLTQVCALCACVCVRLYVCRIHDERGAVCACDEPCAFTHRHSLRTHTSRQTFIRTWHHTRTHTSRLQVLEKLLKDTSTMVLGAAVAVFNEVCPTQYHLLNRCVSMYVRVCVCMHICVVCVGHAHEQPGGPAVLHVCVCVRVCVCVVCACARARVCVCVCVCVCIETGPTASCATCWPTWTSGRRSWCLTCWAGESAHTYTLSHALIHPHPPTSTRLKFA